MPVPMMFAITMEHAVKKPIVRRGFNEAPGPESSAVVELRGGVTGIIANPTCACAVLFARQIVFCLK